MRGIRPLLLTLLVGPLLLALVGLGVVAWYLDHYLTLGEYTLWRS